MSRLFQVFCVLITIFLSELSPVCSSDSSEESEKALKTPVSFSRKDQQEIDSLRQQLKEIKRMRTGGKASVKLSTRKKQRPPSPPMTPIQRMPPQTNVAACTPSPTRKLRLKVQALTAENEKLQRQLFALKSTQEVDGAEDNDEEIIAEVKQFIATNFLDREEFAELIEKIEAKKSSQAMFLMSNELDTRITKCTAEKDSFILDGLSRIRDGNQFYSRLREQRNKQLLEERISNLAKGGEELYNGLLEDLRKDPAYLKKSPLCVLAFLKSLQLKTDLTRNAINILSHSLKKSIPVRDARALFYHFSTLNIRPRLGDERAEAEQEFMEFLANLLETNDDENDGLPADKFEDFFGSKTSEHAKLTHLIQNISAKLDSEGKVKAALLDIISIEYNGDTAFVPPPPPPAEIPIVIATVSAKKTYSGEMTALVEKARGGLQITILSAPEDGIPVGTTTRLPIGTEYDTELEVEEGDTIRFDSLTEDNHKLFGKGYKITSEITKVE